MDKRYQIFISSTFEDLKEERQAVIKGILGLDHMPAGMELFPPTDDEAWRLIQDVIDASDYYVLVIGGRYGSMDETGISYTEKEYDYAVSEGKPVIALLHENPDNIERGKTETLQKSWKKLQDFRKKVENAHTCVYWSNTSELKSQLILGLISETKRRPATGWVKSNSLASDSANEKIVHLQEQVEILERRLEVALTNAPEGTEELSQGNDQIELRVKVNYSNSSLPYHHADRKYSIEYTAGATWNELLGALGILATQPTREAKLKTELFRYIKEKYYTQLNSQADPNYEVSSMSMPETLYQTIIYQFCALNIFNSEQKTIIDNEKQKELVFIDLTPYGRRLLMEVRAIYKVPKNNSDTHFIKPIVKEEPITDIEE